MAFRTGFLPCGVVTSEMQGRGLGLRLGAASFSASGSLPAGSKRVASSRRERRWNGSGATRKFMGWSLLPSTTKNKCSTRQYTNKCFVCQNVSGEGCISRRGQKLQRIRTGTDSWLRGQRLTGLRHVKKPNPFRSESVVVLCPQNEVHPTVSTVRGLLCWGRVCFVGLRSAHALVRRCEAAMRTRACALLGRPHYLRWKYTPCNSWRAKAVSSLSQVLPLFFAPPPTPARNRASSLCSRACSSASRSSFSRSTRTKRV